MSGWEVRFSNSRQLPYFFNPATAQSIWEPPSELSLDQVRALPGASKFLPAGWQPPASAAPPAAQSGPPGHVRASHILCKHAGSRRPSSWREPNITRPASQARQIIQGYIQQLEAAPSSELPRAFAEIASQKSDCSSAKKGGDLGWFGKGMMQKSFEEAAMSLKPGQMSGIVESDSGIHVILRTG
ncbi:putative transcriptional elongation regulator [Kockovaella imperatae]|uniref:Peptidyl-prolyl cis-trans isomerase n=1 Tax=Kockovaella imperatae TaxID=4999 RepID=A0A1Y1UD15_9TREE|nr:putative transcriptional elongation regulator [Kockovaella imperatae]ORX35930.1 putative transcriptional elongation regulator [Kockovaella imperatae]